MRFASLMLLGLVLSGCGGRDDVDASDDVDWSDDGDPNAALDEDIPLEPTYGKLSIDLPGNHGSGQAFCDLIITRATNQPVANINLNLEVIAEGCDLQGECEDVDMRNGSILYSGAVEDGRFGTMVLNYEMPQASEDTTMWMYNVLFKEEPHSRFQMMVDSAPFDILASDIRDADDFDKGPHFWPLTIDISIDMVRADDADSAQEPGPQMRGTFRYDGGCEITARSVTL